MKKLVGKIVFIIFIVVFVVICLFTLMGYSKYKDSLDKLPLSKKIEEVKNKENYTRLNEVPKIYLDAVVDVEDHRFYEHNGFDFLSVVRAIIIDLKSNELAQGGSSITQQLAKNLYFELDRTATRKIAEAFLAHKLEKEYSKDEILELYINTAYYGDGYYTVKEASRGYFGKEPINMTDDEATLLAGIPNAPSVYAPTKNMDLARQRQKQVISCMVKYGNLSQEKADEILK